jgi:sigma-B regulation protein RsbU (phosphoserine phosphatase)
MERTTMPVKILIVDDEPDLEHLIKQKFRRKVREKEFEFFAALNGLEALRILENNHEIDLILTDINMPEMDGLILLEKIRELNNPLLKAIIVSAYGDMENIRTAMNRGAFDFITKPINFDDLEITINKTLLEITTLKDALQNRDNFVALQQELEVARNIQLSILPQKFLPFPQQKRFELDAFIETAQEVGGDFYDFFMIDSNKLGFVIGDVSGKGVPAAIFMAVSKTALKSTALRNLPADVCLQTINKTLTRESLAHMYVTVIFGILDIKNGVVEYCNAGHNAPYILKNDGNITPLQATGGIPLGYIEDYVYEKHSIRLEPGETIFFYTDGVTEALNSKEHEFTEQRLIQALKQHNAAPLSKLNRSIVKEIKKFTGGIPQSDDITLLALKYSQ